MTPADKAPMIYASDHDRAQVEHDMLLHGIGIADEHGRHVPLDRVYVQPEEDDAPAPAV